MTNAQKNITFLGNSNALTIHVITKNVAANYDIGQGEAFDQITARFAEHLLYYMTGDEKVYISDMMKSQGLF